MVVVVNARNPRLRCSLGDTLYSFLMLEVLEAPSYLQKARDFFRYFAPSITTSTVSDSAAVLFRSTLAI